MCAAFLATRDAVLVFDRDSRRFTYVNQGTITRLGYTRDELSVMGPLHIKPMLSEVEIRALRAISLRGSCSASLGVDADGLL